MITKNITSVYYLVSSRNINEIRYIGVTCKNLSNRLKKHLYDMNCKDTHKDRWLRREIGLGYKISINPIMINLSYKKGLELEIALISLSKSLKLRLVNITAGGEGYRGPHTKEHHKKIGKAILGHKHSEEAKRKMSLSHSGKRLSEEHKKKIAEGGMGRKLSVETRDKIRKKAFGRKHTQATKEKLKKASTGRVKSKEEIEKRLRKIRIPVNQLNIDGSLIKSWEGAYIIQRELEIDSSSIIEVCRGKRKTAGGFKWEYSRRKATLTSGMAQGNCL